MNISIFGLGYVGAVSLACLARDGHRVVGVDVDQNKLDLIAAGKTPVVEEGMVQLMADVAASGRVSVTLDAVAAILETDVSLICVGTPSAANGSQDQSAMLGVAKEVGKAMRGKNTPHVFVFRSTLVPGTVEQVLRPIIEAESGKRDGVDFHVCFQPEFLREGSSIKDYDKPPYTIVGANSTGPVLKLRELFGHLPCEFFTTSIRAAEMVKYCCNNFHALKITFANETARLCEALEVDPFEVMDLLCKDRQLNISPAYLKPGFAFGGSCLPKDLRATLISRRSTTSTLPMLGSIHQSNRLHIDHAIAKVLQSGCRKIGLVGLSFKSGTDDLRESPLVLLAEQLIGKGLQLRVFDPDVHLSSLLGANRRYIERHVPHLGQLLTDDLETVINESEMLVIALRDAQVLAALKQHRATTRLLLDLVHLSAAQRVAGALQRIVLVTMSWLRSRQRSVARSCCRVVGPIDTAAGSGRTSAQCVPDATACIRTRLHGHPRLFRPTSGSNIGERRQRSRSRGRRQGADGRWRLGAGAGVGDDAGASLEAHWADPVRSVDHLHTHCFRRRVLLRLRSRVSRRVERDRSFLSAMGVFVRRFRWPWPHLRRDLRQPARKMGVCRRAPTTSMRCLQDNRSRFPCSNCVVHCSEASHRISACRSRAAWLRALRQTPGLLPAWRRAVVSMVGQRRGDPRKRGTCRCTIADLATAVAPSFKCVLPAAFVPIVTAENELASAKDREPASPGRGDIAGRHCPCSDIGIADWIGELVHGRP